MKAGPFKELGDYLHGAAPPDRWVWRVNLGRGSSGLWWTYSGTVVVLDYFDGHVLQSYDWIS